MASSQDGDFFPPDKKCIMHVTNDSKSEIKACTDIGWKKFITCVQGFSKYDSDMSEFARNAAVEFGIDVHESVAEQHPSRPPNAGHHKSCYKRFCDVSKIKRLEEKHVKKRAAEATEAPILPDAPPSKAKRETRSSTGGVTSNPSRRHVLEPVCVICHAAGRFVKDKISGVSKKEKLISCETLEGGQLVKYSKLLRRTDILRLIDGKDLVSIEAKYHKRCYQDLGRKGRKREKMGPLENAVDTQYKQSFEVFCEVFIDKRIIIDHDVVTLSKLRLAFIKTVRKTESLDVSKYRSHNLKKRLQARYPELVFKGNPGIGDIVYSSALMTSDIVHGAVKDSETDTDTDTDTDMSEQEQHPQAPMEAEMRLHFHSARSMGSTLDSVTKSANIPWPPTAETSNLAAARDLVPFQLYNHIAWTSGLCDEPNNTSRVQLGDLEERRVLSICQDIMYLRCRGRLSLPKHVSLSMAVRHLTGSSQLVGLLNGLGHSVSPSVTLEHDTALALQQLSKGPHPIPPGILPGSFTTLVWDNNDFGEETLSGKGTTHNTNGIIIQRHPQPTAPSAPDSHVPVRRSKVVSLDVAPIQLQPYFGSRGKDFGPACIGQQVDVSVDMHAAAKTLPTQLDNAYILVRQVQEGKLAPSWTGFNTTLIEEIPPKSTIGYLPVIDASPTQMDTVQTVLHRSKVYADSLNAEAVAVVFDQAIYAKAQKIRWDDSKEDFKKRLLVRMGAFHTAMTYMACLGTRFKDAGLADIMVESGIVGSGAVGGVMNGHHYNRAIRCHKLTYEAFQRLRWEVFMRDLSQSAYDNMNTLVKNLHASYTEQPFAFTKVIESSTAFHAILEQYSKFTAKEGDKNPNFKFWSSYIDMVQHLLHFVRSARQGDWSLHLSSIRYMLPWMFAYNRTNYSRYLPAYYLEMVELPNTHPAVYEAFLNGEFVVQRQDSHAFAQIPCDQTIESTFNRDTKTKGGLTGFTLSKSAVQRWVVSQPQRAAITNELKDMAGKSTKVRRRKDLSESKTKRDEDDIQNILSTVACMVNPFASTMEPLVQLASGAVASPGVFSSIMNAQQEGMAAFVTFTCDRLQHTSVKFMAAIKRRKLESFGSMAKKSRIGALEITVKSDRKLFARLMLIANVRKLDIQKMLEYCLGPYPLPIATSQGTLRKVNKASLLHHSESLADVCPIVEEIPLGSIWVLDGMVMFQQLANRELPSTMGGLAEYILQKIINTAIYHQSPSIHFVTDRYPDISIKNTERGRRAATGSQRMILYSNNQAVPKQWQKFLADGRNKEALVAFLLQEWIKFPVESLRGVTLFYTNEDKCHVIRGSEGKVTATPISQLACSHEEADTRMLLHASYIADNSPDAAIVIKSLDTDVFIISLGLCRHISASVLFHTGKGLNLRTIDLQSLQRQLRTKCGDGFTDALIGLHAFTGCDSVSGLHGKGKKKPAKLVASQTEYQETFQKIGQEFAIEENLFKEVDVFVRRLYNQTNAVGVNDARYRSFRMGTHDEKQLPPNEDSLHKHIQRANYQAAIWRRSLIGNPAVPSPHGNGWKKVHDELIIDWCSLPPAPDDALNLISCRSCKKGCEGSGCSCHQNGLHCTELCACTGCKNRPAEEDSDESDGDESDEEGSDTEYV